MKSLPMACAAMLVIAALPNDRRVVVDAPVSTLTALPGERVTLELRDRNWTWTAPLEPGLYPIRVDSIVIQAFVLVPYNRVRGEYLNGYRIGSYPTRAQPPRGFIEVTRDNENTLVSPHFRLKQFVCKQSGSYPKYIVLNEGLVQRLEELLALANASGYQATTFHVMSG